MGKEQSPSCVLEFLETWWEQKGTSWESVMECAKKFILEHTIYNKNVSFLGQSNYDLWLHTWQKNAIFLHLFYSMFESIGWGFEACLKTLVSFYPLVFKHATTQEWKWPSRSNSLLDWYISLLLGFLVIF